MPFPLLRPLVSRPLLLVALVLTILVHGALLISGSWEGTYDAHVHLFFADHYGRDWFSTWDTRWYTGFPVTSYPPGAHMLLAAASRVLPIAVAYPLVQVAVLMLLVLGVYRFARLWVDDRTAQVAALLAALSTSLGEVVHVFGQLPTTVGLAFTLHALPFAHRWVRHGDRRAMLLALSCAAAATAGHHVTTLFGAVFFVGPVLLAGVVEAMRTPLPDEAAGHHGRITRRTLWPAVARRLRRTLPALSRAVGYGVALGTVLVVVVLPYWLWSSSDPIVQVPIPHASRENFLLDREAGTVFWLVPWMPLVVTLPAALWRGARSTAWPLAASVALLTVLGLGGTTPVARALLGGAFDILTFDRFTIWATVAVLPLSAGVVVRLIARRRTMLVAGLTVTAIAALLFTVTLTTFRPFQPDPIDPDPIVEFLAKDDHDDWRYLALGFGDQMAQLSARTTATTVDGNYHSARRLPALTTRAVERLEGAKFRGVPGLGSLQQFLVTPEPTHLKYVLSADRFYDPLLHFTGWQPIGVLENGIEVWERPDVPPLPEVLPTRELPAWQRLHWGVVPPAAIVLALLALPWGATTRPGPSRRPGRTMAMVDRVLRRAAVRATPDGADNDWHLRLPTWRRPGWTTTPRAVRTTRIVAVVSVTAGLLGGTVHVTAPTTVTPATRATDYVLALDERRAEEARAMIHPSVRPDVDTYRLIRSVDGGGLLASYSRIDAVHHDGTVVSGDRATVTLELRLVTALVVRVEHVDVELRHDDDSWWVLPADRDASTAAEQLTVAPSASWLQVGRAAITTRRTSNADVLDRPELAVPSVRLLHVEDRWVLVGEVANVDVDPASVVLTAQLKAEDGALLVEWNGGQASPRTLLPGESAPFRIDVEGVAGRAAAEALTAPDFDPEGWTPPSLDESEVVVGADLYARAVVTTRGLDRVLSPVGITADVDPDGRVVVAGLVRNIGQQEAAVPQVLVAALDGDGGVLWTEMAYLQQAVRPQLDQPFEVVLPDLSGAEVLPTPRRFGNGLPADVDASMPAGLLRDTAVPVAGAGPVAAVAVVARAMVRS